MTNRRDIVSEARSICDHIAGEEERGSIEIVTVLVKEVEQLRAENQALRNLAENLRPGSISEALAGTAAEPSERYSQEYADGLRSILCRILIKSIELKHPEITIMANDGLLGRAMKSAPQHPKELP
jgi:hypothetical protein